MNWNSLVTENANHYEPGVFDIRGPTPRPTALASLVSSLAAGDTPAHPVLAVPGWWRRTERLGSPTARLPSTPLPGDRPILIAGAQGTLGRAFQRICALRGLPAVAIGRRELDIAEPAAVDSVLRRLRPWAVVNAAGYVAVDVAERDSEACFRANSAGPATLAAACRRRELPLLTYSSDLVFDGTKAAPYLEQDAPGPLSVYGTSKAEGEQKVLSLLSQALVIRTSAFFGPWDLHNFLAQLFDALDRGRRFAAADDVIVSPTYVPDLVHASLDLLIDQECGVWHLANEGALSWFDFAMLAATRAGRRVELIIPATSSAVCGPAPRPSFSALSSSRGRLLQPLENALDDFLGAVTTEMDERRCASR